jgi:hypothetical protein
MIVPSTKVQRGVLEIKQFMHECHKLDLFDLDTKLMTSVGPVYKQQETSSRYCVANDNLCNVLRYCKLLKLQQPIPQGANHFCEPSDLLSSTTSFSKHCIHSLVFILWPKLHSICHTQFAVHCCPKASTVCVTCTLAEPQNSLPKNGHEHYYDLPKRCIHNFTRQN